MRDAQLDSRTKCFTAPWSPKEKKKHNLKQNFTFLTTLNLKQQILSDCFDCLPVGEIADFIGERACDSKNIWDHVPIETVGRFEKLDLDKDKHTL